MRTRTAAPSVTFAVQDVRPGTARLKTHKTQEAVAARLGIKPEACSDYTAECLANVRMHPLFAAVHNAHARHFPLVLTPDMIWNVILQGLAQHVKNNAERLRSKLVAHAGRKTIEVVRPDFTPGSPENPWAEVIAEFSAKVQQQVGEKYAALVPAFGTTGPVERTACEVALLDTFQPFFQYRTYAACGIPEITLEGTPTDWDDLEQKLDTLEPFELEWWTPHLRMISAQFRRAARGDVNRTFWGNIYKHESFYGTSTVNGWLALLVPYTKNHHNGSFTTRNRVLNSRLDWENGSLPADSPRKPGQKFHLRPAKFAGVDTDSLPSGISRAPFRMTTGSGESSRTQSMEFVGGFVGATQDPETLAIRPKLGWAVVTADANVDLMDRLRDHDYASPLDSAPLKEVFDGWEQASRVLRALPGELMLLYKTLNGVILPNGWRIRPAGAVEVVPSVPEDDAYRQRKKGEWPGGPAFRMADLPDGSTLALDAYGTRFEDWEERFRVFRLASDATVVTGDEPLVGWNLFAVLDAELKKAVHR